MTVRYVDFRHDEFLREVQRLEADEIGAFMVIRAQVIAHGGPIDDDEEWLKQATGCKDVRRWRRVRARLLELEKITEGGGKLSCPVAIEDLRKARKRIVDSQHASDASVAARAAHAAEAQANGGGSSGDRGSKPRRSSRDHRSKRAAETKETKGLDETPAPGGARPNHQPSTNQPIRKERAHRGEANKQAPSGRLTAAQRRGAALAALHGQVAEDAGDRSAGAGQRRSDGEEEPRLVGSASLVS